MDKARCRRLGFAIVAGALLLASCAAPPVDSDGVLRATLSNGLQVVIVRNTLAPVVSTDLAYLVGSRDDPPDIPGLAHAQEHMMFRGTKTLSVGTLATIATALGGTANAQTGFVTTDYTFTVLSSDLDAVLRIEADRMRGIADADSEWRIERGAIDEEVNEAESEPGSEFFADVHALAFRGTSLERPAVGTLAAFARLNGRRLKEFYDRWYAPNNAVLVIAGDVDPETALAQVRARFASIPARVVPPHPLVHMPPFGRRRIAKRLAVSAPMAVLGFRLPGNSSPDAWASSVLQEMLGADDGPLHAFVTQTDATSARFDSDDADDNAQVAFAVVTLQERSDPAAAAASVEAALAAYVKRGVPRTPFERAKHKLMREVDDRTKIDELASNWAGTLTVDHEPSNRHEAERFALVTRDDVNRVARQYVAAAHTVVGMLTPLADDASATAEDAPKTKSGSEHVLTAAPTAGDLPDWGLRAIEAPPVKALAADRIRLSNGMTLVVRTIPGAHAIRAIGDIRMDDAPYRERGRLASSLMDTMFVEKTLFSGPGETESSGSVGPSFELSTTPEDFERAMSVLADHEIHPVFTASNLARIERESPFVSDASAPDLTAIRAAFASAVRPERTTLVIVGDVSTARARAAVQRLFGRWRGAGRAGPLRSRKIPLPAGSMHFRTPGTADKVYVVQDVMLRATDPRAYALLLGNTILGGGYGNGDQNRLARRARRFAGLVYGINSSYDPERAVAQFLVAFGCAPRNERRIAAIVDDEIERMRTAPVSDFELRVAKAEEIRNLTLLNSSFDTIAHALLIASRDGRAFDQPRIEGERLRSVDSASIQSAFAAYIDPKRFNRMVVGP